MIIPQSGADAWMSGHNIHLDETVEYYENISADVSTKKLFFEHFDNFPRLQLLDNCARVWLLRVTCRQETC